MRGHRRTCITVLTCIYITCAASGIYRESSPAVSLRVSVHHRTGVLRPAPRRHGASDTPCLRAWPVRNLEGLPASLAGLSLACGVTCLHPAIDPDRAVGAQRALVADRGVAHVVGALLARPQRARTVQGGVQRAGTVQHDRCARLEALRERRVTGKDAAAAEPRRAARPRARGLLRRQPDRAISADCAGAAAGRRDDGRPARADTRTSG